jgi:hypothetical protein
MTDYKERYNEVVTNIKEFRKNPAKPKKVDYNKEDS